MRGNDTCPSYSHRRFVPSAPIPESDAHNVGADVAVSTSLGGQLLECSSSPLPSPIESVDQRRVGEGRRQGWVIRGQQGNRWFDFQFQRPDKTDHHQALFLSQPIVVHKIRECLAGPRKVMDLISYRFHASCSHALSGSGTGITPSIADQDLLQSSFFGAKRSYATS